MEKKIITLNDLPETSSGKATEGPSGISKELLAVAIEKLVEKTIFKLKNDITIQSGKDEYDDAKKLAKQLKDDVDNVVDDQIDKINKDAAKEERDAMLEKRRKDNKDSKDHPKMKTANNEEGNDAASVNNFLFDFINSI